LRHTAVCLARESEQEPRDGIVVRQKVDQRSYCNRRIVTQVFPTILDLTEPQCAYAECVHNTKIAMVERHYAKVPPVVDLKALEFGFKYLKKLTRKTGLYPGALMPWTPEEVVATRRGGKKATYQKAFDSLSEKSLDKRDGHVKVFVKFEVAPANTLMSKVPRLVQYRPPRFVASIAQYLAPLEHALYATKFNGLPMFAKSMNTSQRGVAIAEMLRAEGLLVGMDHSRFDSHVVGDLQRLEHEFYLWVYKNDPKLQSMLAQQRDNKCFSRSGPSWRANGGRMSGDFNTSLGNNVINAVVMLAFLFRNGALDEATLLLDGDDSVMAIPRRLFDCWDVGVFKNLGMTTKIEEKTSITEQIQFCQSHPVKTVTGWRMVRDYRRVLSRLPYTIRSYQGRAWLKYAKAVMHCERVMSDGVPILNVIASSLERALANVDFDESYLDTKMLRKLDREKAFVGLSVTPEVRASYSLAFDISPEDQVALEDEIRAVDWGKCLRLLV